MAFPPVGVKVICGWEYGIWRRFRQLLITHTTQPYLPIGKNLKIY